MLRSLASAVAILLSVDAALAQKTHTVTIGTTTFDFTNPALGAVTMEQKQFVADYRAARAGGDVAAMRRLVHPASTSCMSSPTSQAYFAHRMREEIKAALPDDVAVVFVPASGDELLKQAVPGVSPVAVPPVAPTQLIAIDYSRDVTDDKGVVMKRVQGTIIRQLAPDGGALRMVEHCLTAKGEELFARKFASDAVPPK